MDLSDTKTWTDGLGIVTGAPHIAVPLLVTVAIGTWWVRGWIEKGGKEALRERVGALEERLRLSQDRESDVGVKLGTAQSQLAQIQDYLPKNAGNELLSSATAATTAISGALHILESLYPNVRVADNPCVIELFSGPERAKLLALLNEEAIYSWARSMGGSTDFVRITRKHWEKLKFHFESKASNPGTINQTYLQTRNSFSMSAYYDLCLNSVQLLKAFPSLQVETSKCDIL